MAKLILLQGGEALPYDLGTDETVIGRHPDCGVQLDSNMVSRRHARVLRDDGAFFVEDLGSGNGTYLNGQRIQGRVRLNHDDRVKLGPILLRFEGDPQARPPVRSPNFVVGDAFNLELSPDEEDSSTITGTVENVSGFGVLDAQPAAKLKGIIEISRSLVGTTDLRTLLPRILDTLFSIFPYADRGCILLKEPATGRMIPSAQKHRRPGEDSSVRLSRTIVGRVLEEKRGILSADAASDARFVASESISNLTIRSMMCVPLLNLEGEPIGIINLDTQNPVKQFTQEDLDLLLAVAGQAALSLESARLLQSHVDKMKQDNELEIARRVQRALLPAELPHVPGWQFFASYESAQAVGGDYYDCMKLGEDKVCVSFGDVAGKGVPGALIMSRIASCVQNTMQFVHDVSQAIQAINNHMCSHMVEGRFVTYVLAIIDLKTNEMSLVNAGHMPPIVRRADGTVEQFDESIVGLPVGIMEDYPYESVSRVIQPGETVVIITDGVDEAMNPDGDLYTKERVIEFVQKASRHADELGQTLLADVRRHANGRPQNDDITIMTFGRDPA